MPVSVVPVVEPVEVAPEPEVRRAPKVRPKCGSGPGSEPVEGWEEGPTETEPVLLGGFWSSESPLLDLEVEEMPLLLVVVVRPLLLVVTPLGEPSLLVVVSDGTLWIPTSSTAIFPDRCVFPSGGDVTAIVGVIIVFITGVMLSDLCPSDFDLPAIDLALAAELGDCLGDLVSSIIRAE